jgi:catechol 2,3-dioxygenase-like lactoylglutathione lyase family enzyme
MDVRQRRENRPEREAAMDDATLLERFEDTTLPPDEMRHREHVRLAWILLGLAPFEVAAPRYCASLRRFAAAHGHAGRYHATMTWAYLALVQERMSSPGVPSDFPAFAVANPDLFDHTGGALSARYDRETLDSGLARSVFVLPAPARATTVGMTHAMRFEGLTLTVESVERSIAFYRDKLGLPVEWNAAPAFAMLRVGGAGGGTIGLLSVAEARKENVPDSTAAQKAAIHVEFGTDDLDGLHEELKAKGVVFHAPPHDEPWERSMTALDPDGYAVEFAQGKRGQNKPAG